MLHFSAADLTDIAIAPLMRRKQSNTRSHDVRRRCARRGGNVNPKRKVKTMKWEYQIVRADTVENFQAALNKLGSEGWEATSGTYAVGESKKVSLGQGMAPSMSAGASNWVALMKRAIAAG